MAFETRDKKPVTKVRTSGKFKLKVKYKKDIHVIKLKDFGFIPETIYFQRIAGSWFTVNAILTPEEMKKEDKKLKAQKKAEGAVLKDVKKSMKEMKKIDKKETKK